jgi:hypothetical protein
VPSVLSSVSYECLRLMHIPQEALSGLPPKGMSEPSLHPYMDISTRGAERACSGLMIQPRPGHYPLEDNAFDELPLTPRASYVGML